MNLLLLHGAGITSSRNKLTEFKKKFDPGSIMVFGEGTSVEDINNNLVSTHLFSESRLVILENPPDDFTGYTIYPNLYTLILWFDHEIPDKKLIISWVKDKGGQILHFPESKEISVFPFLDLLIEGKSSAFLELNKLKKANFDVHYFITMTFYILRSMIILPKNVPKFVRDKQIRQRKRYKIEDLKLLYKNILEIEFKIKSGLLEQEQAEFSLLEMFS